MSRIRSRIASAGAPIFLVALLGLAGASTLQAQESARSDGEPVPLRAPEAGSTGARGPAGVGEAAEIGPRGTREPQEILLTLQSAVETAMEQSYQVRQLRMGIDRTRAFLRAQRARLRTRVDLDMTVPAFESVSEYEYNSDLGRYDLVHENSRRWQANLSVRQPVVLFGFPTNGYLSLNTRVYRYTQLVSDQDRYTRYYNRYFVAYEQPLFQPNELRNELQEAEYDLEEAGMDFEENVVELIDDIAGDYYELFETAYEEQLFRSHVERLERAVEAARALADTDPSRDVDVGQIQVELANAREQVQRMESDFRLQASRVKQRLRLDPADSIVVRPALHVEPVAVDPEQAIEFATTLRPALRELEIERWEDEVEIDEVRSRNSFRMDVELSYGREMDGARLREVWDQPRNSYEVAVNARLPIWDWGAGDAQIEAAMIGLEQTELRMEERVTEIESEVRNAVQNLAAYQQRALDMEENLALAERLSEESVDRYAAGETTTLELLRALDRRVETGQNFLDTYLGYRRALLDLQEMTYYDFEQDVPVLERYGVEELDDR